MKDWKCCPQRFPNFSFSINYMYTHACTTHTPALEQHAQQCTSGELTVCMVPSPGDPGCGSQEVARCKLGERWVQKLSAHSFHPPLHPPPPLLPFIPLHHPMGYRWPKWGRQVVFCHSWRLIFLPFFTFYPWIFFLLKAQWSM